MRAAAVLLVFVAVATALALYLSGLPGEARLTWPGFEIAAPSGLAAVIGAVGALLLVFTAWLLATILRAPRSIGSRRRRLRRAHGETEATAALVALAAGEAERAERHAKRARKLMGEVPLTMLLSAQSARLAGRSEQALESFQAMSERPDTAFLGLRGQLALAIERDDVPAALKLVREAAKLRPDASWLPQIHFDLAVRAGSWGEALPLAAKLPLGDLKEARRRRAVLAHLAAGQAKDPDEALSLARSAHEADQGFSPAALDYARRLRAAGRPGRADKVLEQSFAALPAPELVAARLAEAGDGTAKVRAAKALAKLAPTSVEGELAQARAALDAQLWGEARSHLQAALKAGETRRAALMMAELEESERGSTEEGRAEVRHWLKQAAEAQGGDTGWRCDSCGAPAPEWQPVCGSCGSFGTIAWGMPVARTAKLPAPTPARALLTAGI